jgi:glyoxylase-like metal-dependent hydrolase (beta-lactamase superfamily II)
MTRSTSTRAANQHRLERRRLLRAGAATLGAALLPSLVARPQDGPAIPARTTPQSERPPSRAAAISPDTPITTTDLGGLALLQVADCNVLAMHGNDGALMVDGGPAATADALVRAVLAATHDRRVAMLVDTHWHLDQIGANEIVGRAGGTIFATEKTKLFLSHSVYADSFDRAREPLPEVARPTKTTRGDGSLDLADQKVDYGYLPAAHTDGDLFVHFPQSNVLAAGGVVSGEKWPLLDWRNGAWYGGRVRALERLASIVKPDTRVVPAQGRLLTGRDVLHQRDIYDELFETMIGYMNMGLGAEDVVVRNPLKKYESELGDPSEFLDGAYRSMQIAYVPD